MIKVPLKVTYGILTALDLAFRFDTSPVQAKIIARRQNIPIRFIEQILHSLKQGGIIESLRGPQGGYSLRRDPAQVSLADIMEAMNGPFFSGAPRKGDLTVARITRISILKRCSLRFGIAYIRRSGRF